MPPLGSIQALKTAPDRCEKNTATAAQIHGDIVRKIEQLLSPGYTMPPLDPGNSTSPMAETKISNCFAKSWQLCDNN